MGATAAGALPSGRVALLFSDIQGSTALLNRLGEAYGDVLDVHDRVMRDAFDTYGGYEFSNEGDAFGAAFGDPVAAAEAALEVQQRLDDTAWPRGERIRVRMGLHYGEPKVRGQDYWGEDVHFAARVCSAAHGGQIVMSAAMRATVGPERAVTLGHHGLKDFPTPRELFQLTAPGAGPEQFPPLKSLSTFRSNLPSIATPLIGRDQVLDDLAGLFADGHRLVTLTGAGGMGKTRVAIALGERLGEELPDGVAFVPLAAVDPANVATAVAEATGAPRGGDADIAVQEHLARRRMLVILDNCEHLVEAAAALVTSILEHCPRVVVLATAQLPLDLAAERVHRLPPLVDAAARMFIDRACSHDATFTVTEAELQHVEELCALLDGFPLAIELAAARVRLLGVERLLRALRKDLHALGAGSRELPERHRTLETALTWTLSLLTSAERDAFVALAAFAASWSLEEAEQLLDEELDEVAVWEVMTRLMDASLVVVRGDGRFAMPQRVRQHASELLAASADEDRRRRRHAEVVGQEMRELVLEMYVDYRRMVANAADLLPEVLQAVAWARSSAPDFYRHVVGLTAPGLGKLGHLAVVADDVPALAEGIGEPRNWDDAALVYAVGLCHAMRFSTDTEGETAAFDAAARGFAAYGDPREVVQAGYMAGAALEVADRLPEAIHRFAEPQTSIARIDDPRWRDEFERRLAYSYSFDREGLGKRQEVLARVGIGTGVYAVGHWYNEALIAGRTGEVERALGCCAKAFLITPVQQLYITLNLVKCVAWLLAMDRHDAQSVEVRAAIQAIYHARTGAEHGNMLPEWAPAFAASDERLGEAAVGELRARGAGLSYDELVDRARRYAEQFGSTETSAGVEDRA